MKCLKKMIYTLLLVVVLISIPSLRSYASTTLRASVIASYLNGRVNDNYPSGMCLAFVADCFQNMGASRSSSCCAYNYGNSHIHSTSMNNIPVGADVFFGNCGGGPCKTCGSSYYGHIGVYVGNGNFVHATNGKVYSTSINNAYWSSRFRGWGYHGNVNVTDDFSSLPTNPQVSRNQIWYDLTDTIEIYIHADGATNYYMSMFKDGEKIIGEGVDSGTFSMPANRYGTGSYSAYFSCSNSAGTVDSAWIDFGVVGPATYNNISVSKPVYHTSDTVSISVDTVCAKGQTIGIDRVGDARVVTQMCDSTFTIPASDLGVGQYSAYFSVYNGSGGVDTKRVTFQISVIDSDPVNLGEEFYAYIEHQKTGLYLTNQQNNIAGEDVTGEDDQVWKFTRLNDGSYKISSKLDDSYIDVQGVLDVDSTNVYTWPEYTGGNNQKFYIYNRYGAYYFRPAHSYTKVFDMASSGDHNLAIWAVGNDWAPQEFNILKRTKPEITFKEKEATIEYKTKVYSNSLVTNSNGGVSYESSDENVAIVDESGQVLVKGIGTVTISAKVSATDKYLPEVAEYKLTVTPSDISEMNIKVEPQKYTGEQLRGTVAVVDGENELVQDVDFVVEGNQGTLPGEYPFTVRGIGNYTGEIQGSFRVEKGISEISVAKDVLEKTCDEPEFNLNAVCTTGGTLIYSSNNASVATVDTEGNVSVLKAGEVDFTIKTEENEYYESSEKTVKLKVNLIHTLLTAQSVSVKTDDQDFVLTVATNSDGRITYSSDNTDVATVDENGEIHIVGGIGSAIITVHVTATDKYDEAETKATITVQAPEHNYSSKVTKEASCTVEGVNTFTCSHCDDIYTEVIPKKGHDFSEWQITISPTCVQEGYRSRICSRCGKQETQIIEKTDQHNYESELCGATCTKAGYTLHTCVYCGLSYKDTYTNVLGHTEVIDKAVSATCTTEGKTVGRHCEVCNTVIQRQIKIPALGHDYDDGVITKEATCTEEGVRKHTCSVCEEIKDEVIKATGHQLTTDKAIEATCTEDGMTAGLHCSKCNEVIQKQEIVKTTGHKFDAGEVTEPVDCTKDGKKVFTCIKCGEKNTEIIKSEGHKTQKDIVKATLYSDGKIKEKCTQCGEIIEQNIIHFPAYISLSQESYTYNGKVQTPSVIIKGSDGKDISHTNYTISYSSGRKNIGHYSVQITFKGNYTGTVTKSFEINPKGTNLSKAKAGKKQATVKWKKQTKYTKGYQIQYSTSKSFANGTRIKNISGNNKTSFTIKKLKSKKTYYFRIRTYQNVSGGKCYSSWSKAKRLRIK